MYLAHAFQPHHWHVSLLPLLPGSMLAVARCQSCHPSNEGGLTSGNSVVDLMSAHLPSLWAFAGLTSESTNQSLICGANATWRWQSGSLGAHTHPPTTGWTWCLILQHVLSTWVLLLMTCLYMCSICIMYGRCLTVAVGPDSCTVQLSLCMLHPSFPARMASCVRGMQAHKKLVECEFSWSLSLCWRHSWDSPMGFANLRSLC